MSPNESAPASAQDNAEEAVPAWTEPPWTGWIETTGDALLILEAARRGMIPRVTRRLVDSERRMITSGSVFVFDEDESGIKRWTDGFFWSPSRILGNFLLYRETEKKTNLRGGPQRSQAPTVSTPSIVINEAGQPSGLRNDSSTLSRPKNVDPGDVDKVRERSLFGSLTNTKKFKSQGMMKKTFSLSIGGVAQHLISYYNVDDVEQGRLRTPSSLPELAALEISPEYLDKTHFRVPPRVEYDSDGVPRYRGEADEPDSPTLGLSELPSVSTIEGIPTPSTPTKLKRTPKRFDPYGEPVPKQRRKPRTLVTGEDPTSGMDQSQSQTSGAPVQGPTSPTSPTTTGTPTTYDATTYFQAYGVMPGPGGTFFPVPAAYYPPTGHPIPYMSYPPAGSDPHTYPTPTTFYPQHVAPHTFAQQSPGTGPGHGVPVGMMHYYPTFTNGWRPVGGEKTAAEENQKPGDDEAQEAVGLTAST